MLTRRRCDEIGAAAACLTSYLIVMNVMIKLLRLPHAMSPGNLAVLPPLAHSRYIFIKRLHSLLPSSLWVWSPCVAQDRALSIMSREVAAKQI